MKKGMIVSGGLFIIAMVCMMVALTGCATFFTETPTENDIALSRLAVSDTATITAIQKPEWVPEMLKVSATVINGVNSGKVLTLADVRAIVNKEAVDRHFSVQTIAYANLFLNNMIFLIEQKGQVSLNVPVQLCMVAQWINNAIGGTAVCTTPIVVPPVPITELQWEDIRAKIKLAATVAAINTDRKLGLIQ